MYNIDLATHIGISLEDTNYESLGSIRKHAEEGIYSEFRRGKWSTLPKVYTPIKNNLIYNYFFHKCFHANVKNIDCSRYCIKDVGILSQKPLDNFNNIPHLST